jgi:hypothetical protein
MKDEVQAPVQQPVDGIILRTFDEIIAALSSFTDDQRSLAWCPETRTERQGTADCRAGADCGLDFDRSSLRSRWLLARFRWEKEQRRRQQL